MTTDAILDRILIPRANGSERPPTSRGGRQRWAQGKPVLRDIRQLLVGPDRFLAHGIPAITLRTFIGDKFPRKLHSAHDSRDRISVAALERGAELLRALVDRVDSDPALLGR